MEHPAVGALDRNICGSKVNMLASMRMQYVLHAVHFLTEDRNHKLKHGDHATSMQKYYDSRAKSSITLGIRPPKMPSGQGIRTQKWSNPLLCPVGVTRMGHDFDRCIMPYAPPLPPPPICGHMHTRI